MWTLLGIAFLVGAVVGGVGVLLWIVHEFRKQ